MAKRKAKSTKGNGSRKARSTRRGDTAARILEAADQLLGERGYDGVSVADIAERAGVNKALVFYHFESKDELTDRVLERYYQRNVAAFGLPAGPDGDPGTDGAPLDDPEAARRRVHQLIDAQLAFIDQFRAYPRFVQQEVGRTGGHLPRIRESLAMVHRGVESALAGLLPEAGPLASKHFFLTFMSIAINYFTYAPALDEVWGEDPLGEAPRAERREHVHWVVDAALDRLFAETA